jgi:hypothetical protein
MSSADLREKLRVRLSDHDRLLKELLRPQRILRGSFHQVYTRCGKANCWCAKARRGHAHTRLTWSEGGTFITRKVPAAEREHVAHLTNSYRQFREQRGQLSTLQMKIQDGLDQYEKALIQAVRGALSFLAFPSGMSAKSKTALQARRSRKNQTM